MRFLLNRIIAPFIFYPFLKLFNRLEIIGIDNIPETGAVVIVANHISMWDAVILYCAIKRRVCFMAKEELFRVPVIGYAISKIDAFPVKRDTIDRNALRIAARILEEGRILGIFPEGHRSMGGAMREFKNGAALFAHRSKSTVIPVLFENTDKAFPKTFKSKIRMTIGPPIDMSAFYERKANQTLMESMTKSFLTAIKSLAGADTGVGATGDAK